MPELPEVQTTVNGLKKKVLNRAFVDVWTDTKKIIKKPKFSEFKKRIKNKKIKNIKRQGKNIILNLSGYYSLLIHLKMTGHLLYNNWQKDKMNSFIRVKFFLDNNKILALCDLRKFAKIELHKTPDLKLDLGPDPLDKSFTFSRFKKVLRKGRIKQVLMDQKVIAGIGNIYSDEILWQAKANPFKNTRELSEKELKNIYLAAKKILKKALKLGGTSVSDYRNVQGRKGSFEKELKVYRKQGQKCPRCTAVIKREKIGQRSCHFCPKCQKLNLKTIN